MTHNGANHRPKPEPIWIALGVVVSAMALSLGRSRRKAFIDALETLTEQHEAKARVVAFGQASVRSARMTHSIRVASTYLRRLVVELRSALE